MISEWFLKVKQKKKLEILEYYMVEILWKKKPME